MKVQMYVQQKFERFDRKRNKPESNASHFQIFRGVYNELNRFIRTTDPVFRIGWSEVF